MGMKFCFTLHFLISSRCIVNNFEKSVGRNEYLNEMKYFNPWISNTGLITWVPEIRLHSRCMIKVSDFPFDTQCCEINFYSWAHTINQMKIQQYGDKNITNLTHLFVNLFFYNAFYKILYIVWNFIKDYQYSYIKIKKIFIGL